GRTLAFAVGAQLRLWEVSSGKERRRFMSPQAELLAAALSPDGQLAFAGDAHNSVHAWSAIDPSANRQLEGHQGAVSFLAVAAGGKVLVSGGEDTTVILWDLERLKKELKPKANGPGTGELESLWADLAGADGSKAYQAVLLLAAAPAEAVPLFQERLQKT